MFVIGKRDVMESLGCEQNQANMKERNGSKRRWRDAALATNVCPESALAGGTNGHDGRSKYSGGLPGLGEHQGGLPVFLQ